MPGFFSSTGAAVGELFGVDPSQDVLRYRQDNMLGGIASDLLGVTAVYAPWAKYSLRSPGVKRLISYASRVQNPIGRTAVQEIIRFAPLEFARAGGKYFNDVPIEEIALDTIISLAVEGGLGTIGGLAKSVNTETLRRAPLSSIIPGEPAQSQVFKLRGAFRDGEHFLRDGQKDLGAFNEAVEVFRKPIYTANPVGNRFSSEIVPDSLFKRGRKLVPGEEEFSSLFTQLTNDSTWFGSVLLPRTFRQGRRAPGSEAPTKQIDDTFTQLRETDTHEIFYKREENSAGLYLIHAANKTEDSNLIFKTAEPGYFAPELRKEVDAVLDTYASWGDLRPAFDAGEVPLAAGLREFDQKFPAVNFEKPLNDPRTHKRFLEAIGLEYDTGPATDKIGRFIRSLQPSLFQFRNPRANHMLTQIKLLSEKAENLATRKAIGTISYSGALSIGRNALRNHVPQDGLHAAIRKIDDFDSFAKEIHPVLADYETFESIPRELIQKMTDAELDLTRSLYRDWGEATNQLTKTHELYEQPVARRDLLSGGAGLNQQHRGQWRVPITYEGNPIFVASGTTEREALRHARYLQSKDNLNFPTGGSARDLVVVGDPIQRTPLQDRDFDIAFNKINKDDKESSRYELFRIMRQNSAASDTFIRRPNKTQLSGFLLDRYRDIYKQQAKVVGENELIPPLYQLSNDDPEVYRQLQDRMRDYWGIASDSTKKQNDNFGKIPFVREILGPTPATTLAQFTNTGNMHLTLGSMNVGFGALNAASVFQTVLPQLSLMGVMIAGRGGREAEQMFGPLSRAFVHEIGDVSPVIREGEGVVGHTVSTNPLKLLGRALKQMGQPTGMNKTMLERAQNAGVFDPRFVEEFIGPSAPRRVALGEALASPQNFGSYLRSISEFIPAKTERFARTVSFLAGVEGAQAYGITDPDIIYAIGKKIAENTQFLYNTADRSRLFTTPIGSVFGLFKHWQSSYISAFAEYAGVGKRFIQSGGADGSLAPMAYLLGGTSLLAGFTGLPLAATANGISQHLTDKSIPEHLYGSLVEFNEDRGTVSDAIYYGIPAFLPTMLGLPGLSFGSAAAAPFADPVRDADLLTSFVLLNRAKYLGQSISAGVNTLRVTGANPLLDRETTSNFARALLPKTVYRAIAAQNEDLIRSISTGNPQVRGVTPGERFLYSLGFNPTKIENQLEINSQLWRQQSKRREVINEFGQEYLRALENNDARAAEDLLTQAAVVGVDPSSIIRSATAQEIRRNSTPRERELKNAYADQQLRSISP